ncbi:MAG TPA: ABC transporter permease, partial [Ktedonobacteraceae bacterium]|nr:ABC transporter permease [Ktedonobacteraceae bacterium]
VATLALGIGANTAVFSIVYGVLVRALPYNNSERLLLLGEGIQGESPRSGLSGVSLPNFHDWSERNRVFDNLSAYTTEFINFQEQPHPQRVLAVKTTSQLLSTLDSSPQLGRGFLPDEDQPGKPNIAILSSAFWKQNFNSDPAILGKPIALNGQTYTVIGVMPVGFSFPPGSESAVFMPLQLAPEIANNRGSHLLHVIGRLKPGVRVARARQDMDAIAHQISIEYPEEQKNRTIKMLPLHQAIVANIKPILTALMGAVLLVLLITCVNVANLLVAHAHTRKRETAVRIALGAGRSRLIRQFLTESALLGCLGGLLGIGVAYLGIHALMQLAGNQIPHANSISLNGVVLEFLVCISLFTSLIFGMAPVLQTGKADLHEDLKAGTRTTSGGRHVLRMRHLLVVSETSLALILLVTAGLLVRTVLNLYNIDPGFTLDHVIAERVSVDSGSYGQGSVSAVLYQPLLQRLAQTPGVTSIGLTSNLPAQGAQINSDFHITGQQESNEPPSAEFRVADPGYFRTLDISILRGRGLDDAKTAPSPQIAVINDTLARKYFSGQDPVGQQFTVEDKQTWKVIIVGVVSDTRQVLQEAPAPEIYFSYLQLQPDSLWYPYLLGKNINLVVKTNMSVSSLVSATHQGLKEIGPDQLIYDAKPIRLLISESLFRVRAFSILLTIFAVIALLIAVAGIYGVVAYIVSQRTKEFGVRMALGAARSRILLLVLKHGLAPIFNGIAVGLFISLLLGHLLNSLVYGVSTTDILTLTVVAVLLVIISILACCIPAYQATTVNPITALRDQ